MATSIAAPSASTFAPSPHYTRPTFLMCPPEWYGVDYVINPWMAGHLHGASRDLAFAQWRGLYDAVRKVADVRLLHAEPGCPDMVFLGHGALVHHGVAALASFSCPQRRGETAPLRSWLHDRGMLLWDTSRETAYEGEGDITFNATGTELWAAHGSRTCKSAHRHVASAWHVPVHSLHLVDPRFYHLDTCFAPLSCGDLLYFPGAFDAASLDTIHAAFPAAKRVPVSEADATRLACGALSIGPDLFTGELSDALAQELAGRGYRVKRLPLGEF